MASSDVKRCFCIDFSLSIKDNSLYHSSLSKILKDNYRPGDQFVLWDHNYQITNYERVQQIISSLEGRGGTAPIMIVNALKELGTSSCEDLFIITDGQIGSDEIDVCDSSISDSKLRFKKVTAFVIETESTANLSVVCPFTRGCPHIVYSVNSTGTKEIESVTIDDWSIITSIDSITDTDSFLTLLPSLKRTFAARTMGTIGDTDLRESVLELQKRFSASESPETRLKSLTMAIKSQDFPKALEIGSNILQDFDGKVADTSDTQVQSGIQALLRMTEGALRNVFDMTEIASERAFRAKEVEEIDELSTAVPDLKSKFSFVCPISYENEVDPAICIVKPDEPLLVGLGENTTNQLLDCPLNGYFKFHFMDRLRTFIDHPISLKTLREAREADAEIKISPITRKELLGIIPLGAHQSHVKAADWTLSRLFTGGKSIGQPDLWFALFYFAIVGHLGTVADSTTKEKKGEIEYLQTIVPFVREQLVWRLTHHKSRAALTGLPGFISIRMQIATSLWFVLASPAFTYKPKHDPLRLHLMHPNIMIKLLDLVGYQLPPEIYHHIKLLRALFALLQLSHKKRANRIMRLQVKGLYQAAIRLDKEPFLVMVDGAASEIQKENMIQLLPRRCLGLTIEEIVGIAGMVSKDKAAHVIDLPFGWKPDPLPAPVTRFIDYTGMVFPKIQICAHTMRPFLYTSSSSDEQKWSESFNSIIGENQKHLKVFSGSKMLMKFVKIQSRWPRDAEDLVIFWSESNETLPERVGEFAEELIRMYEPFYKTIRPREAVKRFKESAKLTERERIEREGPSQEIPVIEIKKKEKGSGKKSKKHTAANLHRERDSKT